MSDNDPEKADLKDAITSLDTLYGRLLEVSCKVPLSVGQRVLDIIHFLKWLILTLLGQARRKEEPEAPSKSAIVFIERMVKFLEWLRDNIWKNKS